VEMVNEEGGHQHVAWLAAAIDIFQMDQMMKGGIMVKFAGPINWTAGGL
jgi:hypothetical protein